MIDGRLPSYIIQKQPATDLVEGEYAIGILNRDPTKQVAVWAFNMSLGQIGAVTGALSRFTAHRFTSLVTLSGGTDVSSSVVNMDESEPLAATVDIRTKFTNVVVEGTAFTTTTLSVDEPTISTLDMDGYGAAVLTRTQHYWFRVHEAIFKPLILRSDGTTHQGFCIKDTFTNCSLIANSTIHFTVYPP